MCYVVLVIPFSWKEMKGLLEKQEVLEAGRR